MLLPEHERFHKLGPKETIKPEDKITTISVRRTTAATGEEFIMEIPMYASDTREELNDRVNMFLSVMQDRMEDENKALLRMAEKAEAEQKDKLEQRHKDQLRRQAEKAEARGLKSVKKDQ